MLERLKNYKLSNGKTINEYLTEKFNGRGHWEEKEGVIEFRAPIPGLKSQAIYRWSIEGDEFYAVNGKAIKLTPELILIGAFGLFFHAHIGVGEVV